MPTGSAEDPIRFAVTIDQPESEPASPAAGPTQFAAFSCRGSAPAGPSSAEGEGTYVVLEGSNEADYIRVDWTFEGAGGHVYLAGPSALTDPPGAIDSFARYNEGSDVRHIEFRAPIPPNLQVIAESAGGSDDDVKVRIWGY